MNQLDTLSAGLSVVRERLRVATRPIREAAAKMRERATGDAVVRLSPPWQETFRQLESEL